MVRPRRLLPLVLICAAAGGLLLGGQLWLRHGGGAAEPLPEWEDSFAGEAFSPQATAQQLNEESERVVAEVAGTFPQSPAALNVLARWKYVSGDLEKAVQVWQQCLDMDPNFSEPLYALGAIAIKAEEYERAIELLGRLRQLNSSDVRVPVLLAEALLKSGRVEDARVLLEQHVRTQPTSAEAMAMLGQVYLQLRDYEKAVESYGTALRAVPEMRSARYGLGQAYARMGEKEKAREAMEIFRAQAQAELQDESHDVKTFRDLDSRRTLAAQAHDDAAKVYRDHGSAAKAEELWRKAAFLDPQNTAYRGQLLTLYEQTGQYPKALQVGRQLVKLHPGDVDHWLNVGALSARLDRPAEALAAVERAIALEPDNPRCREAYELVHQSR